MSTKVRKTPKQGGDGSDNVVLFGDHLQVPQVSDEGTTTDNNDDGRGSGRRKSTRERRKTSSFVPHEGPQFANSVVTVGHGFACPYCGAECGYADTMCEKCFRGVRWVDGVGPSLTSDGPLVNEPAVHSSSEPEPVPDELDNGPAEDSAPDSEPQALADMDQDPADEPPSPPPVPRVHHRSRRRRSANINPSIASQCDGLGLLQDYRQTPEYAREMAYLFNGNPLEVVATNDSITVDRQSMCVLRHKYGWIHDSIIDFFGHAILKSLLPDSKLWYFNSHFMDILLRAQSGTTSHNYEDVIHFATDLANSEGGNDGLFSLDHLFVPINFENNHWLFLHVQPKKRIVKLYDSQGTKPANRARNRVYLRAMKQYLYLLTVNGEGEGEDAMNEWAAEWAFSDASTRSPVQTNGYDCGVFTIVSMYLLSQGHVLTPGSYSQATVASARIRMNIASMMQRC